MGVISKQNCSERVETASVDTPIGRIDITVCPNGLHRLSIVDHLIDPNSQIKVQMRDKQLSTNKWINESVDWLDTYFRTTDQYIDRQKSPPFCPFVTKSDFNRKVWSTLQNSTEFGQTVSYSELALRSVGNQRASRAVGTAMKNNPFLLMVPCHRVIKSDGTIGQFSGGNGKSLKEWLLSFEKKGSKQ